MGRRDHETSLKRSAEELAWRVERAKQVGVVYSVEAHVGSVAPTPADARQLVELSPGLTLTLDYTHFIKQGISEDECESADPVRQPLPCPRLARGPHPAAMKENVIDFERVVLQAMQRADYPGYVGVEYVWSQWEHCDEVDNLSETVMLRDKLRAAAANGAGQ